MKQFRDILVYAEVDDENCLAQVVAVAAAHGAAITVCEVVEPPPLSLDSRGIIERVSRLRSVRARERLRRIVDQFAEHMLIDFSVFTGVPFVTITEQVVRQNFDLVVHISDPVQVASGIGLNATGMHLMRKCPCAIWALHPDRGRHSRNVVLALDRERTDETTAAEAFAITLAETAIGLAEARAGELHIVHAWRAYGHDLLDDPELDIDATEREFYVAQQRRDNETWFRRMAQRVESMAPDTLTVHAQLLEGRVMPTVQKVIEDCAAGMLVLGTVGTSANPGILIGPTTESMLAGFATSVLALKPPGFVSPLVQARPSPRASE